MEIVQQRDAATLLPIINAHTAQGYYYTLWYVGSIPKSAAATSSGSWSYGQSLTPLCWSHHWCTYSEYRELLEPCKDEAEEDEGVPCYSISEFMWRERHGQNYKDTLKNNARHCSRLTSVNTTLPSSHLCKLCWIIHLTLLHFCPTPYLYTHAKTHIMQSELWISGWGQSYFAHTRSSSVVH